MNPNLNDAASISHIVDNAREEALRSNSWVRLITGDPGVGKTYFGCELAEHELSSSVMGLQRHQKVLFLTFARNAVARIRHAYLGGFPAASDAEKGTRRSRFLKRVRVDTFGAFSWWLVDSYGRYAPGVSDQRPWLLGNRRSGLEHVPGGHAGYTFEEIEQAALAVLKVGPIRQMVCDIYPFVIVDEFQDVCDRLFDMIALLGQRSRLVLLSGPDQCIYRTLRKFDPERILNRCMQSFHPETFRIKELEPSKQRFCPEIKELLPQYDRGTIPPLGNWPIRLVPVARTTSTGIPKEIETQAGLLLGDMKRYLTNNCSNKHPRLAVLVSTNQGAADMFHRLRDGSKAFRLSPVSASLHFDDLLLLHYGRLIFSLLAAHWIGCARTLSPREGDAERASVLIASLFQHGWNQSKRAPMDWLPLAREVCKKVTGQRPPNNKSASVTDKLRRDLDTINGIIRAPKQKLPSGSPSTPFHKGDLNLLGILAKEILDFIQPHIGRYGCLNVDVTGHLFEKHMLRRVIFEKLGIERGVQVMTIHKSKGREFDGVVLVLEDNLKAMWRKSSRCGASELEDIYRVAISRARYAFCLVAFNDARSDAHPAVQKLLPEKLFH